MLLNQVNHGSRTVDRLRMTDRPGKMGQFIFHCGFLDDDMPKEGRSSRGWTRSRYGGLVVGHGNKATRDVENRVEDLCTEDMGWKSLLEEDPNW